MNEIQNAILPPNQNYCYNCNDGEITVCIKLHAQKIVQILGTENRFEVLSRINTGERINLFLEKLNREDTIDFDINVIKQVVFFLNSHKDLKVKLHINLSPHTLSLPNFLNIFLKICNDIDFKDFHKLSFEILENGTMIDDEITIVNINIRELHKYGIKIGIDDYPNENNNNELLGMLQGIDFIKIDKGIILRQLTGNITIKDMINGIEKYIEQIDKITCCKHEIIIEGIENREILTAILTKFGSRVRLFQGYYFGHPSDICNILQEQAFL